jgi:hypothetical protein
MAESEKVVVTHEYTESIYSEEETDFLRAIQEYKRKRGRPFPTWREVLAVTRSLGYRRVLPPVDLPRPVACLRRDGRIRRGRQSDHAAEPG